MLWHNNPSPSVLMVNVTGSPEEPPVLPSAGQQRLFVRDSDGHLCRIDSGGGVTDIELFVTPTTFSYLLYQDQQTQNTEGGTFTSGAWRTRVLNTEVADSGGFGVLSSNQVTLDPGTYVVQASAPAFSVDRNQLRLQNITDTATLAIGQASYAGAATVVKGAIAILRGQFTIGAGKALELQHQAETTRATNGFGVACNFATPEVYAVLEFWKIG